MNFSIVLPLRNQVQLTSFLSRLYDPSSSDYHHFLSVKEFADRFGPTADDYQKVLDFAAAHELETHAAEANRMTVPLTGSVAQVEKAFFVKMRRFQHPTEVREFFSPDREPSVPAGLPVRHIAGLDNFAEPVSMTRRSPTGFRTTDVRGSGPDGNYMASDMRAAYYGGTTLTGRGQTLGLVQFDGYNIADVISAFHGEATLSSSGTDPVVHYTPPGSQTTYSIPIHNVLLDEATGAPGQFYPPTDDGEQVLDIVQSIGMAPGLSQVRVYIGNNDYDVLSKIASENLANEVSISWAWTPSDPSSVDPFFMEMAAQGQSVFVASGDYGAFSAQEPWYFPAEDQWVTAVGGTHLTTDGPGGALTVESAWTQSGGGISPDAIPIPNWQAGIATSSNRASNTLRNIPDVAMEADFDNFNCDMGRCGGGWAGTSFASPRWAAFTALVNEQALANGDPKVGFLNPGIYATGQGPDYGSQFHDVDLGKNDFGSEYGFYAVPGYDLVTGWGSPTGQNLIDALAPVPGTIGFQLSTTQGGLTLNPGTAASTTIGVVYQGGFTGSVSLAVTSTLPSGVSASFGTNPTTGSSVLTITANVLAVANSYVITVTGTSGSLHATTYITVVTPTDAVAIISPAVPTVPVTAEEFKPGTPIQIYGTVLGEPQDIVLQWAPGIYPASGWHSPGVTASGGLTAPYSNALVGTFDTSPITTAGYYTIQLSATYTEGTASSSTLVYVEPDLISRNWPRWLDTVPDVIFGSGIVPVDDGIGNTELALLEPTYLNAAHPAPRYRVFSFDGSSDQSVPLTWGNYRNPAFGHLDPLDKGAAMMADGWLLPLIDNDGTRSSFPLNGTHVDFTFSSVVLADLKGDSTLATVAHGNQCWNQRAFIYAWDSNQRLLTEKFPIQISCLFNVIFPANQEIAVGDIDGDGKQEIVALEILSSTTFTFGLFANDGSPRTWAVPTFDGSPGEMILADLDGNGKLEMVVGVNPPNTNYFMLHILEPDGTERNGWPVQIPSLTSLAAGDLARTGTEQIVASAGSQIFILNRDGTPYSPAWPLTTNSWSPFGPVILADIDGDGYPEILAANGNYSSSEDSGKIMIIGPSFSPPTRFSPAIVTPAHMQTDSSRTTSFYFDPVLQAYHRDGTVVKSWHVPGMHGEQPFYMPQLSVGDFNHDGITDIAILNGLISGGGTGGSIVEGMVEVLSTGSPYNPAANDWPMMYHDTYNSASTHPLSTNSPQTSAPAFSLPSGNYRPNLTIAISDTTPGASIYYTTDGSIPTSGSTRYWGPITVSSSETIQALATASGYSQSAVASAAYTITLPAPEVTVTPSSSSITTAQSLQVTVTLAGPPTPTGTVALSGGTYSSTATTLSNGSATITIPAGSLATGSNKLTASYTPDTASSTTYTSATGTASVTVTVPPSFTLSASPASVTVAQRGNGTSTISVTGVGAFSGTVTLTATGLPAGATSSFAEGTAAGTQVLTLTASSTAEAAGPVTVTITGTSGNLTASTTIALTITAEAAVTASGDSGSDAPITIAPGANNGNTSTISVKGTNGFSGTVNLACSISPTAASDPATCTLSPSLVTLSGNTAQTSTLTVRTTAPTSAAKRGERLLWPAGGTALALLLFFTVPRRRSWLAMLGLLAVVVSADLIACGGGGKLSGGGNSGTTPGTYTVTVTGNSGAISATVGTVTLTVQ